MGSQSFYTAAQHTTAQQSQPTVAGISGQKTGKDTTPPTLGWWEWAKPCAAEGPVEGAMGSLPGSWGGRGGLSICGHFRFGSQLCCGPAADPLWLGD